MGSEAKNLLELVERYLEYARVQKRLATRTLALYTEDLKKLQALAQHDKLDLIKVQQNHIRRWVAHMHSKGRSGRGIALILSGWRGFYTWLGREGLITSNPVADVKAPKSPKPLPKALSVDEAVQLASFADTQSQRAIDQALEARDAAITELLYGSGLRVGELVGLDVQSNKAGAQTGRGYLDLQAADAHVVGKGSKSRTVPLSAKSVQALQSWLGQRYVLLKNGQNETALFVSPRGARMSAQAVWQRLRQRARAAGLQVPVHPHMLRHSFASHLLQSSQDIRAVQELLGHANISTTQVYTRLDFQHLAKAYDAAHPRAKR